MGGSTHSPVKRQTSTLGADLVVHLTQAVAAVRIKEVVGEAVVASAIGISAMTCHRAVVHRNPFRH